MTPRTAEDCDRLIEAIRYPNLFTCTPLNARITERTCLANQGRWQHERHEPLRRCGECEAGQEIAERHGPVEVQTLPSGMAADPTDRLIAALDVLCSFTEPPPPWTPHGPGTCKRNGCQEREYGKSNLCFGHLRRQIGEPYHYAPGPEA